MAQKTVQIVPVIGLLKASQCSVGTVYVQDDTDRPIMFISGEDVSYAVVDQHTGERPESFRVGVYLDSGQLEGFSNHSPRFRAIGSIECS